MQLALCHPQYERCRLQNPDGSCNLKAREFTSESSLVVAVQQAAEGLEPAEESWETRAWIWESVVATTLPLVALDTAVMKSAQPLWKEAAFVRHAAAAQAETYLS